MCTGVARALPADTSLATWTATALVDAYADGSLSPVEVHDAVQQVIEEREMEINAFWVRDTDRSRFAAIASERRWRDGTPAGPIDGVPLTLKENVARAGVPMPAGSAGVEPVIPERDTPITSRVLEAGGVVLGSTVMPDWGMLSSGVSSLHGITRSPWNLAWTTGGSSAGAGAAAAGGYGPLHVGTDIGGSLRLPATWLGLVTLKPSAGRIPLDAPYLGRCAGPLTRTTRDAAMFMQVLAQPDERDWTSLPPERIDFSDLGLDVHGLRIGLQIDAGCGKPVEPAVARVAAEATRVFEQHGAIVEPVEPFIGQDLLDDLDTFWRVRSYNDYNALPPERQVRVLPYVANWCRRGSDVPGTKVLQCYQQVMRMQEITVAATAPYDYVVSPVAPLPAFAAEQPMPYPDDGHGMGHIGFTVPYNMSGQPASSINAGFTDDGRPVGVQIAGHRFDDLGVLRATSWYERHRPESATPHWPDPGSAQQREQE